MVECYSGKKKARVIAKCIQRVSSWEKEKWKKQRDYSTVERLKSL